MVGFRIRRGATRTVLGISPVELEAGPVSVGTLCARPGCEFEARLAEFCDPTVRITSLPGFLAALVADACDLDGAVLAAIDRIDDAPDGAVKNPPVM
jgi:hypothetical protein